LKFKTTSATDSIDNLEIVNMQYQIDSLQHIIQTSNLTSNSMIIVEEYRNLISLFGIGFGLLIGLFGLVFPLLLYFIQVKPSIDSVQEAKSLIKRLDDDFENSFKEHLRKAKTRLVDEALEHYRQHNTPMLSNSYHTIDAYKNERFTELQVVKMIKLLKSDLDEDSRDFFAKMLIYQEDENAENYFVNMVENSPTDGKCIWAAIYFATFNKKEYLNLIANIVINGYPLGGMMSSLAATNKDFALHLLNSELLLNKLDKKELNEYADYGIKYFIEKTDIKTVESTLFWQKLKNE
jgi:hypothetical protein